MERIIDYFRRKIFEKQCYKLRQRCMSLSLNGKHGNSDGVVDPKLYFQYKGLHIMWILKEAYGNDGIDQAKEKESITKASDFFGNRNSDGYKTFGPIIQLAYLLVSNINEEDVFESKEAYTDFKKSTCYVNIKKSPGTSSSDNASLEQIFKENDDYRKTLIKQIKLYKPDIIIGGNTLQLIFPSNLFNDLTQKNNLPKSYEIFSGDIINTEKSYTINKVNNKTINGT